MISWIKAAPTDGQSFTPLMAFGHRSSVPADGLTHLQCDLNVSQIRQQKKKELTANKRRLPDASIGTSEQ